VQQLIDWLQDFLDEIRLSFFAAIGMNTLETRLRRLRLLYYRDPKVTTQYRQVKEILKDNVSPQYYDLYHQLLATERTTYQMLKDMHKNANGKELMEHLQDLSEKAATLIDQVQHADSVLALYADGNPNTEQVTESRAWLMARVHEVLEIQSSIPARILSFQQVTSGRGVDKLSERLERLTNHLDDIAESYNEIDRHRYKNLASILEDTDKTT